MRGLAIVLLAAACQQQQAAPPPKTSEVTFDGAQVTDAAALRVHGERLTHVLGCTGCHGEHLEGMQFEPKMTQYGPIYASNLTVEAPEYTDAQLDGIIRQGTHPERKTLWIMPAQTFQHLSDADMKAVIAYLRSLKPIGNKTPPPQFSALDKKEIAEGIYKPAAQIVREEKKLVPVDLGQQTALGRYITEVTCAECHGTKLDGDPAPGAHRPPNLIVASGYTRAEFERLITQGIPTGGRKLNPMMSGVATTRFVHLTPHERDAVYAYLKARAEKSSP
jgi:cytochrome c553